MIQKGWWMRLKDDKWCPSKQISYNSKFVSNFIVVGIPRQHIFPWFIVMAWSCKRDWLWKMLENSWTGNWFEKNRQFRVQFASVSEKLLVSFFPTIWRNIKWFLRVDTVSKCFVHIWKRVHKKSEASEALSSWCFFRLNEVAIFLKFAIYFIKILLSS